MIGRHSDVDAAQVRHAVEVLLRGGLVGFPTETVYGLGADADQEEAVGAIFRAKGRPHSHPLIVHVAHARAAEAWAREIPQAARVLMDHFWPGPLTLILARAARARDVLTGGQDTVGVRCPADPWAQALLRGLCSARGDSAAAVAAPSANRYGRISPTCAAHVLSDLGEKPDGLVDFILDGGSCTLGIESTIVDFSSRAVRILRPGSIGREQIAAAIGATVTVAADEDCAPRAPGRDAGHYAPRTPLELVAPAALAARAAALLPAALGILAPEEVLVGLNSANVVMRLPAAPEPEEYAHELYARLRDLDAGSVSRILVAAPPAGSRWDAVHNRLARAAAGSDSRLIDAD